MKLNTPQKCVCLLSSHRTGLMKINKDTTDSAFLSEHLLLNLKQICQKTKEQFNIYNP